MSQSRRRAHFFDMRATFKLSKSTRSTCRVSSASGGGDRIAATVASRCSLSVSLSSRSSYFYLHAIDPDYLHNRRVGKLDLRSFHTGNNMRMIRQRDANVVLKFTQQIKFGSLSVATEKNEV